MRLSICKPPQSFRLRQNAWPGEADACDSKLGNDEQKREKPAKANKTELQGCATAGLLPRPVYQDYIPVAQTSFLTVTGLFSRASSSWVCTKKTPAAIAAEEHNRMRPCHGRCANWFQHAYTPSFSAAPVDSSRSKRVVSTAFAPVSSVRGRTGTRGQCGAGRSARELVATSECRALRKCLAQ